MQNGFQEKSKINLLVAPEFVIAPRQFKCVEIRYMSIEHLKSWSPIMSQGCRSAHMRIGAGQSQWMIQSVAALHISDIDEFTGHSYLCCFYDRISRVWFADSTIHAV